VTTKYPTNQNTPSVYSNIDDYVKAAHEELRLEMDAYSTMVECKEKGWTEVHLDPWKLKSLKRIEEWIANNCYHQTHRSGNSLLFESKEESSWFRLRWL
jgi:hypothetical protein